MAGVRDSFEYVTSYVIPSVLIFITSFLAPCLPVEMSMPRTAISIIMMLTIQNMRSALAAQVGIGYSWLEKYFFVGLLFTFCSFLANVISLKLHAKNLIRTQRILDEVAFYGLTSTFPMGTTMMLYARNCDLAKKQKGVVNKVFILSVVFFLCSMCTLWRKHRTAFIAECLSLSRKARSRGKQKHGEEVLDDEKHDVPRPTTTVARQVHLRGKQKDEEEVLDDEKRDIPRPTTTVADVTFI